MTEKKLIPFDLEKALAGDGVIDKDGIPITQIKIFKELNPLYYMNEESTLIGIHKGKLLNFNLKGETPLCSQLYMAPKIKTYWINILKDNYSESPVIPQGVFETKEDAIKMSKEYCGANYIKTISFEFEVEENNMK